MNLTIKLDSSTGSLLVTFENRSTRRLRLRDVFPPLDIFIVNEDGDRAEFYLSMPYGAKLNRFVLDPGEVHFSELNLASDFIYPKAGIYKVWIDYDSSRMAANYDTDPIDSCQSRSNSIQFPISFETDGL